MITSHISNVGQNPRYKDLLNYILVTISGNTRARGTEYYQSNLTARSTTAALQGRRSWAPGPIAPDATHSSIPAKYD